jgi:hypothetical protein
MIQFALPAGSCYSLPLQQPGSFLSFSVIVIVIVTRLSFFPTFGLKICAGNAKAHEKANKCNAAENTPRKCFALWSNTSRYREEASAKKGSCGSTCCRKGLCKAI